MGRSNKEARPNQVVDGGGKFNMGAMGAGSGVKPKDTQSGISGRGMAEKKAAAPASGAESAKKPAIDNSMENKSGWDKIGAAGASMVETYNTRKKASE